MKKVEFYIPKIDKIIKLLGNVYSDPRDAFTEFIVNSIDANANIIKIVIKKGKINKIIIQDNGIGMNNLEMERVVKNIGNSIKLNPDELIKRNIDAQKVIGHMGIGILGFQSFCNKVVFISKIENDNNVWTMTLEINKDNVIIDKASLEFINFINFNHGTTVILEYISTETMRLFNINFLNQYIQKNLSALLRTRKDIKIILEDNKNIINIEPLMYSGIPFSKNFIYTKNNYLININIYIQPTGTFERISIITKGKEVVKEIIKLPEFQRSPWVDGFIHGFIEADFLNITPTRDNYIRDDKFYEFVEAVKSLEKNLLDEIINAKEKLMTEERKDMLNKLRNAVLKALKELELESLKTKIKDSNGKKIIGDLTEYTIPHEPGIKPRFEKHNIIEDKSEENEVKSRYIGGLNIKWDHLGNQNLHSILKEGCLIIINEDAEDYKNEFVSGKRKLKYLAKLIAKELSKYNNPNANTDDIMEISISLELKILRNLNLL